MVVPTYDNLLRGVSRSFYLSLRLLPRAMREPAGCAYLLARLSDTIADCGAPLDDRLECLDQYTAAFHCGAFPGAARLAGFAANPAERVLLERSSEVIRLVDDLPDNRKPIVREVLEIIAGGQRMDLVRFGKGGEMPDFAALEDYTWRVAGCVGEFWTKLGFLTFADFSSESETRLMEHGRAFGMGLQLVNILRDVKEDLAAGRCYLPPDAGVNLIDRHRALRETARSWVRHGFTYARAMNRPRLRVPVLLPARIAMRTLELLDQADASVFETRVKVPRKLVYWDLIRPMGRGDA